MDPHTPESEKSATVTDTPAPADGSRRSFLQGAVASGAAALGGLAASSLAHAQTELKRSTRYLPPQRPSTGVISARTSSRWWKCNQATS